MVAQQTKHYFPAFACAIAAILWGLFWYPLRLLEEMGVPGLWSSLIIYAFAMLFLLPAFWKKRADFSKHKLEYILIGFFAGWTNLAFILAVLEGEIVRVLLLFYLSPIWAIFLAVIILRERLTMTGICSLVLAMVGAGLMLWRPDQNYINSISIADFYAITAGMAFAVTNIVVRKIGDTPYAVKIGVAWLGVLTLTISGILLFQMPLPTFSLSAGILCLFIGFPFMLIMTWTAQYGVTHLPIQRSSVIFLLEIVAGAISAALLTNEVVKNAEYIGGFLIVSAGLISIIKQKNPNIIDT